MKPSESAFQSRRGGDRSESLVSKALGTLCWSFMFPTSSRVFREADVGYRQKVDEVI